MRCCLRRRRIPRSRPMDSNETINLLRNVTAHHARRSGGGPSLSRAGRRSRTKKWSIAPTVKSGQAPVTIRKTGPIESSGPSGPDRFSESGDEDTHDAERMDRASVRFTAAKFCDGPVMERKINTDNYVVFLKVWQDSIATIFSGALTTSSSFSCRQKDDHNR